MKQQLTTDQSQRSVPVHYKLQSGKQQKTEIPITAQRRRAATPPMRVKHGTTQLTSDNKTSRLLRLYSQGLGNGYLPTDSDSHLRPPQIEQVAVGLFTIGRDATDRFYARGASQSWLQLTEAARVGWRTIAIGVLMQLEDIK
jgi:hypothetical protein